MFFLFMLSENQSSPIQTFLQKSSRMFLKQELYATVKATQGQNDLYRFTTQPHTFCIHQHVSGLILDGNSG